MCFLFPHYNRVFKESLFFVRFGGGGGRDRVRTDVNSRLRCVDCWAKQWKVVTQHLV